MRKHMGLIVAALVIVAALLASTVFYRIDELKDVALVKTFGEVTKVLRGSRDAGLHFKWPWPIQRLVRYDARTRIFEDVSVALQTGDKQQIIVTMYCTWRIEDPVKFHTSIEKVSLLEERLKDQLRYWKTAVIGKYELRAFVNTDPKEMRLGEIEAEILTHLHEEAARDYGIDVRGVGIRANALTEKVSQAVIAQQKSERERYVKDNRAKGEALAVTIEARASAAEKKILEFAKRKAADIETKGWVAAAGIYARFKKAPELAIFLRQIESLKEQLKDNSVFVLDSESSVPGIDYFRRPPAQVLKNRKAPAKNPGKDAEPK